MEGGRAVRFDASELVKSLPEVGVEDGASVGDHVVWKTVRADDARVVEVRDDLSGASFLLEGDEVGHFGEPVDDDEDRVVALGGDGELDDEVHGD